MGLREELLSVMQLQRDYSSTPTESMQRRREIIRARIPALIRSEREALHVDSKIELTDFLIEGSDGIGRKARAPWVRFSSRHRSPSASHGWYVVWLFREDGTGAYLALAHASTENVQGDFVDRSPEETQRLMEWARQLLATDIADDPRLANDIWLGDGRLARAYERTSVTCYFYPQNDIPMDSQLLADMRSMASMLGRIHLGEPAQRRTGETSLDSIAALTAIEEAISGRVFSGQGIGLTQAQRRAVELRAMTVATDHLTSLGFSVEDTSASQPYDLKATREGNTLHIEVKGTTGALGDIVLTNNEVEHHKRHHPNNGLIVVHGIKLNKGADLSAEGGTLHVQLPWRLDSQRLTPIAFRYCVGQQ